MLEVSAKIPEPPEGWGFDGYRRAVRGEMSFDGKAWFIWEHLDKTENLYFTAVRKKQWRTATAGDIGKPCRFMLDGEWYSGELLYLRSNGGYIVLARYEHPFLTQNCEVQE